MKVFGLLFKLFMGAGLIISYHYASHALTESTLADFFETGSECNSLMRYFPVGEYAQKALQGENGCYLKYFDSNYAELPEDERSEYLSETLDKFKTANRLDQQTLLLLAHSVILIRNAQKQKQYLDHEKEQLDLGLTDDLLTIAESSSQFKVPVVAVLAWSHGTILDLQAKAAPAQPPLMLSGEASYASEVSRFAKRYQALKDKWLIKDEDLARFKTQWLAANAL